MAETFTTGQVAEKLGVPETRLQDLIRRRKIKRPDKINGRRRWSAREIEAAKDVVGRNP